jgi:hypothetical protein
VPFGGDDDDRTIRVAGAQLLGAGLAGDAIAEDDVATGQG